MCKARSKNLIKLSNSSTRNELISYSYKRRKPPYYLIINKIIFGLSFIVVLSSPLSNVQALSRVQGGFKELQTLINKVPSSPSLGHCDFEDSCDWSWNKTNGFRRFSASETVPPGPKTDASKLANGKTTLFV